MNDDEKNIPESNNGYQETDKARDINFFELLTWYRNICV